VNYCLTFFNRNENEYTKCYFKLVVILNSWIPLTIDDVRNSCLPSLFNRSNCFIFTLHLRDVDCLVLEKNNRIFSSTVYSCSIGCDEFFYHLFFRERTILFRLGLFLLGSFVSMFNPHLFKETVNKSTERAFGFDKKLNNQPFVSSVPSACLAKRPSFGS